MMPPKDNITLGPGTLYFNSPEGLQPLGEIKDIEFTEEAETFAEDHEPIVKMVDSAEVTLTVETTNEAFKALAHATAIMMEAWNKMWETLKPMVERYAQDPKKYSRITHLAKHGKNKRIRKKNAKRLAQLLIGK